MKYYSLLIIVASLLFASCRKDDEPQDPYTPATEMEDLRVPSGFSFSTYEEIHVDVSLKGLDNQPLNGVRVDVYEGDSVLEDQRIGSATTDAAGNLYWTGRVSTEYDNITVKARTMGIPNIETVNRASTIAISMGGDQYSSFGKRSGKTQGVAADPIPAGGNLYYMGTFDNQGVPTYLEAVSDQIGSGFLDNVNASLPESSPVPYYNPSYLSSGNETDIVITELADVWVTFVHEGAGYKNVLGFYTYPTGQEPNSASQIDSIFIIFPNLSFANSGGGLLSGDKVKLGRFPAGVSIGTVLIADGWNPQTQSVRTSSTRYYSNANYNPEWWSSRKQHNVQLFDQARDVVLTGYEDVYRQSYSCDNDFNDAIYYVTSNPVDAIETTNLPPVTVVAPDQDADGVPDAEDDFPSDANKSFDYAYTGTLGFEDLWPFLGDFDFNDLVAGYRFNQIANAQNQIVEIEGEIEVRAVGAGNNIGLALRLGDLPASSVASVTGTSPGNASVSANGTESGQSDAVIVVFDDVYRFLDRPKGLFFNTDPNRAAEPTESISFTITFNSPVDPSLLGQPPYDSFIVPDGITSGQRTEIHLPDHAGTDLADQSKYGFGDDDSNPGTGRYYRADNHLPWAINLGSDFDHPIEYTPIIDAYSFFAIWVESNGEQYPDWFLDLPGFRNDSYVW